MNTRQKWGMISIAVLLLVGFGSDRVPQFSHDNLPSFVILTYILALCCAIFVAFYDKRNFSGKMWDFNPRRGLLYFFLGFLIFPFLAAIEFIFGAEISLEGMIIFALIGSVLIGILGIFTEHVGI